VPGDNNGCIEVSNLRFSYAQDCVIKGCSFRVSRGVLCCLLGRNGSGKSTLLRLINGTLQPDSGQVTVDGIDVHSTQRAITGRKLGFVPQKHNHVFPYRVLDMVVMGRTPYLDIFSRPSREDYLIADKALDVVGISHLRNRSCAEISGGEEQLVFIARAITQEATYFLLDEPTSHLDFANQHMILTTIRRLVKEQKCAAVVAMHDPNLSLRFADHIVMLDNGVIIHEGPTDEVMTEDNLEQLYDIKVKVADVGGGGKCILPRSAAPSL
jgi:iron complex transport system ATP-binding protein